MADGRAEHPAERADADAAHVVRFDGIADGGAEPAGAPVARLGALSASVAGPGSDTGAEPPRAAVPPDGPGGSGGAAEDPDPGAAADLGRIGAVEQPAAPVAAFGADPAADHERGSVALFDTDTLGADRTDVSVAELGTGALRRRRSTGDRAADDRRDEGTSGGSRRAARGERGGPRRAEGGAGARGSRREAGRPASPDPRTAADPHAARPHTSDSHADTHAADQDEAVPGADQVHHDAPPDRDAGEDRHDRRRGGRSRGRGGASRRPGGREELDPDADPIAVAREICLRMLTDRARTRQELAQALQRKGVPDDAAHSVLDRFDEVGLIDDAAFAGQWVRSRHNHRRLARRAIAMELRRKGVSEEDADEALAEVDEESEAQRARELVDRKLRSLAVGTTEQRAAAGRRLVGMLARKGYGAGTAYRVVKEALAERGAESDELGDAEPPED